MFYMTLVPTGDEIVLLEAVMVPTTEDPEDKDLAEFATEVLQKKIREELTARVWKGTTNSGNPIEVAIVRILDIDEMDEKVLNQRLHQLFEEGEKKG